MHQRYKIGLHPSFCRINLFFKDNYIKYINYFESPCKTNLHDAYCFFLKKKIIFSHWNFKKVYPFSV